MQHTPVMLNEVIDGLKIKPNGVYVDGTLGLGGHAEKIASNLKEGKLICFDLDERAIELSKIRMKRDEEKVIFFHDNFKKTLAYLDQLKINKIDGVLLDLGVSSMQIDTPSRGFSYMNDGPIDMRMDLQGQLSGEDIINNYSNEELKIIFRKYGEEKLAAKISQKICEVREKQRIDTTKELAEIINSCYPSNYKGGHPAKRVFQGLRIYLNKELEGLYEFIVTISERMNSFGRIVIISFHSLEDRIVKNAFKYLSADCICDESFPICVCDKEKQIRVITKKPLVASETEIQKNSRALSAKLRIAEKI